MRHVEGLSVLMLDREDFDKMELRQKLRLPKREAIQPPPKAQRRKQDLKPTEVSLIARGPRTKSLRATERLNERVLRATCDMKVKVKSMTFKAYLSY